MSSESGKRPVDITDYKDDQFADAKEFSTHETTEITLEKFELKNKNNSKLFCRYWKPAGKLRATVMLMHGYGEHLQWYHHVGVSLAQEGYLAFGHDHVGHGRSEGLRVVIDDIDDLVDDSVLHANKIKQDFPNVPTFLVGHSMGGLIALLTAVKHPTIFKGVVFNGPFIMLGEDVRSPVKKWCARNLCKILPNMQVGKLKMSDVTGDEEMIKKITADPLWWQGGIKLRTGAAFLNTVEDLSKHFASTKFPFLIIHGAEDKICDPEGSKSLMKMSPSEDKQIKLYQGAAHHLYLDKRHVRDIAIKDTVEWICKRVD